MDKQNKQVKQIKCHNCRWYEKESEMTRHGVTTANCAVTGERVEGERREYGCSLARKI